MLHLSLLRFEIFFARPVNCSWTLLQLSNMKHAFLFHLPVVAFWAQSVIPNTPRHYHNFSSFFGFYVAFSPDFRKVDVQ